MLCSLVVHHGFGGTYCFYIQGRTKAANIQQASAVKMEAVRPSETSVNINRPTRLHIPEDSAFHSYRCENL
jgi:hypothetical protein